MRAVSSVPWNSSLLNKISHDSIQKGWVPLTYAMHLLNLIGIIVLSKTYFG